MIEGYNKQSYLIVYSPDSTELLEGNFYDQYANGHCIRYDGKGRKTSEGDYRIKGKGKRRRSVMTGTWRYYNSKGVLLRKEEH